MSDSICVCVRSSDANDIPSKTPENGIKHFNKMKNSVFHSLLFIEASCITTRILTTNETHFPPDSDTFNRFLLITSTQNSTLRAVCIIIQRHSNQWERDPLINEYCCVSANLGNATVSKEISYVLPSKCGINFRSLCSAKRKCLNLLCNPDVIKYICVEIYSASPLTHAKQTEIEKWNIF